MENSLNVYRLCSQIPKGQVSTYKCLAIAVYGSPHYSRLVVINSNFSLGGFATGGGKGSWPEVKRKKLASEGILFNDRGYLRNDLREKAIFNDFSD
ncbi:17646_t:CDS:2 [Gigaspora margarita]|uniref:17646_t:CDS:1 n=1 Tax=Gigaspora margarita TaxID=4874 RepID=A0ABM8VXF3_GIGMA|nr:17646_t:CDS:2 [Gigaspora margarita]